MLLDAATLPEAAVHDLLKSCIVPRPIAWVSTIGRDGEGNAAPFSCFTFVATRPPLVCLSIERKADGKKDTLLNIEETGVFVVNLPSADLAPAVNASAANFPRGVNEIVEVGLTPAPCTQVAASRIAECPISLECRVERIVELGRSRHSLVIGEVLVFHLRDGLYRQGIIDPRAWQPLARLSGDQYARLGEVFELPRPWVKG